MIFYCQKIIRGEAKEQRRPSELASGRDGTVARLDSGAGTGSATIQLLLFGERGRMPFGNSAQNQGQACVPVVQGQKEDFDEGD